MSNIKVDIAKIMDFVEDRIITESCVVEFNGENLSSGVYFYQIKAKSFVSTKKLVLLK